jgi:hypothetical protein
MNPTITSFKNPKMDIKHVINNTKHKILSYAYLDPTIFNNNKLQRSKNGYKTYHKQYKT